MWTKFHQFGRSPDFWWPFEVFGPIGRNGNEKFKAAPKFLGTDIKNLHMQKLRLAAVYRLAKFRDDTMTFTNIKATFSKRHCPP